MADVDFSSLAANILPTVIGGLAGARNGAGLIPGAAIGMMGGMAGQERQQQETQRYNDQVGFRNQQQALAVRREQAQEGRWAAMDKQAEENSKYRSLEMQKIQAEMQQHQLSQESWKKFVDSDQVPADLKDLARAQPQQFMQHYIDKRLDPVDRPGAAALLTKPPFNMSAEEANKYISAMPIDDVRKLPGKIIDARVRQRPFHVTDYESGNIVEVDPNGGQKTIGHITPRPRAASGDPKLSVAQKAVRAEWEKTLTLDQKLNYMTSPDAKEADFEEYFDSPEGRERAKLLTGKLSAAGPVSKDAKHPVKMGEIGGANVPKDPEGRQKFIRDYMFGESKS